MNVREFGQTIKQKYPQYQNVDDEILGQKMLEKYPQYKSQVTETVNQAPFLTSLLEKTFSGEIPGKVAGFMAPRTTALLSPSKLFETGLKAVPSVFRQRMSGEQVKPINVGQAVGEFTQGVIKPATGVAAELSSYLMPTPKAIGSVALPTMAKQLGVRGAITGGLLGATSPEEMTLEKRGLKTAGEAALGGTIGAILGKGGEMLQKNYAKRAGQALLQSQYNVPRTQGAQQKLRETVERLSNYGIRNIDDVQPAAEKITGNNGVITKITREAAGRANPIDTTGLDQLASELASDPLIPKGQDEKFIEFVKRGVQKILGSKGKTPSMAGNPIETFGFIQDLESKAAYLLRPRPYSMTNTSDEALGKAYSLLADELKDRLFVQGGADQIAVSLVNNPEVLSKLNEVSPKLAQDALQVKSVGELRHLAEPFVKGWQMADLTYAAQALATKDLGQIATGVAKVLPTLQNPWGILTPILGTRPVTAGTGGLLTGIGNIGEKVGGTLPDWLLRTIMPQVGRL